MKSYSVYENIDPAYGCEVAKKLSLIGNDKSEYGFKNAGSTGEKKAAAYIMEEMKKIGIHNVSEHCFSVDSWEFKSCSLTCEIGGKRTLYPLSSFAGTNGGKRCISAKIVDAGHGTYEECKEKDIKNSIALIRIDLSKNYWLGPPVYQLELKGALAVIVVMEGTEFGNHDTVLNSGDCISRPNIPIVNISRKDGRELIEHLKKENVAGELNIDFTLSKGQSRNITGEIQGKIRNKYILLGGHYDGYFNAYLDDAFGIGLVLTIAKAIIESGYVPEYTIKIIAHGAEEFGVSNSHYDWCIGSWQQINNITPEWACKIKLFLNIDAAVPDADRLLVQAAPQLHYNIEKYLSDIKQKIKINWPEGYNIRDINGPWSDDFCYYMKGIPVIICGRGKSQWKNRFYHTNLDDCHILNIEFMEALAYIYLHLILAFDKEEKAYDIAAEIKHFYESIDEGLLTDENINVYELKNITLYLLKFLNSVFCGKTMSEKEKLMSHINTELICAIRSVDFDDNAIYKLDEIQKNIKILDKMYFYLSIEDYRNVKKEMSNFSGYSIMNDFENEVYEYWCRKILDENTGKLQWAKDLIEKPLDIRRLYYEVHSDNAKEEIFKELDFLKRTETDKARKHIKNIIGTFLKIIEIVKPNL